MSDGSVTVSVPPELIELVAIRAAELVVQQLAARDDGQWPAWMSIETAARYLDSPVQRLRKLVARREIPYSQEAPGCRVFFARADLDQWMAARRTGRAATTLTPR